MATILRGDAGNQWSLALRATTSLSDAERTALGDLMHDAEMQRILASDFGWKHAAPPIGVILSQPHAQHTLFVLLTKHPYFWLQSFFRNPYTFGSPPDDFSSFIRKNVRVTASDCLPTISECDPPTLLRLKMLQYRRLADAGVKVVHLRYEDLIREPNVSLDMLSRYLVKRKRGYVDIDEDVKGSQRRRDDFMREYSLETVGDFLSDVDKALIVEKIGEDLFEYFGYKA